MTRSAGTEGNKFPASRLIVHLLTSGLPVIWKEHIAGIEDRFRKTPVDLSGSYRTGLPALIEVFYHANVFLEHLLRLENDVTAVGGDIYLVGCERMEVVEIIEKGDGLEWYGAA